VDHLIAGTVWKCNDDITAYEIIAQRRWNLRVIDTEELGKWVFEDLYDGIRDKPCGFKELGYDIVVAGHNFGGGGKSIEHPVAAMQGAGVKLVLAESFSRYNFRNAINRGLPAMACPGISSMFQTGDKLTASLQTGNIKNISTGALIHGTPFPDLILQFLDAGGMLNYYCARA
jgi:3-isopropylmalate/(R)-2-methylmalate dehydratase small subunit